MFNFSKKKQEKDPLNLEQVIEQLDELKKENKEIKAELEEVKKRELQYLKKPGVVRFNPFPGEGGNQSFSLALINKEKNGVVITTFYTKEGNRVYGKPIKNGSCEYALSKEEKQAIRETQEQ
jgi:hypothetical protein